MTVECQYGDSDDGVDVLGGVGETDGVGDSVDVVVGEEIVPGKFEAESGVGLTDAVGFGETDTEAAGDDEVDIDGETAVEGLAKCGVRVSGVPW